MPAMPHITHSLPLPRDRGPLRFRLMTRRTNFELKDSLESSGGKHKASASSTSLRTLNIAQAPPPATSQSEADDSLLRTNILVNLAGSGWIALLTLVATPIQIHLLGVESYGLIGLIAVLQIIFGTLDLGLSASVTQAVSADLSDGRKESAPLINSAKTIYWLMALLIAAVLWLAAAMIATRWLKPQSLDTATVLTAVRMIGLYVAIRWPIAFYTGALNGIQRMDVLNLLKAGCATLRIAVGIIVILVTHSLTAFLVWFAISALIELLAFAATTHRLIPMLGLRPFFSMEAIRSVWRFSLTMAVIAVLSMLITQLDRILVSKLLSLDALGYYTLAYTAGIGISLLQMSINTASLPAFAEAAAQQSEAFARRYSKVSELMAYAIALPSSVLIFFGSDILRVWVGADAARGAGTPLMLLAVGCFLNAVVSSAYIASVGTRRPDIPAAVNAIAILVYVPALYLLISAYGIIGAAACWMLLNIYYLCSLLPAVHHQVVHAPLAAWLWRCLALPALLAIAAFMPLKSASVWMSNEAATWVALAAAMAFYAVGGFLLMSSSLRAELSKFGFLSVIAPSKRAA
jgi:O-antigen/teichoic acid export membrane protein